MNKKKIIVSIFVVAVAFSASAILSGKKPASSQDAPRKPIGIFVQSAADSKIIVQKNQFPAMFVGDQEIKITAKSAGTVVSATGDIGSRVAVGSLLARIDDSGSLAVGEKGFQNIQVQQLQLVAEQAKKSYGLAKDEYARLKDSSSASSAEKDSAKTQRDIAKLQYENAILGLNGSIDSRLITSPISGVITNKAVSVGDSVSVGQLIAVVSKSSNIKVQFYVDQEQRTLLNYGQEVVALDDANNSIPLIIRNISVVADQSTKRFLIEAYPKNRDAKGLFSGTIATVDIENIIKPSIDSNFILPLSVINVGQNEDYIFTVENNIVKKVIVEIVKVNGETVEISAQISPETMIITDGNKLVQEGESVEIKRQ
ncbi:MAG: efflux RND transporter periplasmic adaptor subunit [Candidatus Moranbacteria bacterium]|jgi:RND family efflux transporter MFP subunit|nr:efflux RND transporter periplasmic adaptor subunit [Candidatus Moranbacteria bacterium]